MLSPFLRKKKGSNNDYRNSITLSGKLGQSSDHIIYTQNIQMLALNSIILQ
jgi:hypothetical protein